MSGKKPRRYFSVQLLVLVVTAMTLVGCGGQINFRPTLSEETLLTPTQGVLTARVINASGSSIPFNQLTVHPENLNESSEVKQQRLVSLAPSMNGTAVFSSPMEAGNYTLGNIRAFYSGGERWYSRFVSAPGTMGTFTIEPGKVTDIGTLLFYQKPQGDKFMELLIRVPYTGEGEVLSKHFPFMDFTIDELLGWNADDYADERESIYVSIAQNPIGFNQQFFAPDGSLYFPGKVGVFLKRYASGDWEIDGVDTNLELTSIAENSQGDLIVGGSEGALFWRPIDGEWQDLSLGHDVHIEHLAINDSSEIEVLAIKGSTLDVLRGSPSATGIDWEVVNTFSAKAKEGWQYIASDVIESITKRSSRDRRVHSANLFTLGQKNYILVSAQWLQGDLIFSPIKNQIFEYDPSSWEIKSIDEDIGLTAVIKAGNYKLGIEKAGFWSLSQKPSFYRIDPDGTRTELSTTLSSACTDPVKKCPSAGFTFSSIPWFSEEGQTIAIASFSPRDFQSGNPANEVKIITSSDGGLSWSLTDNAPPKDYCTNLIPEISDRLLVSCNGANGDFYESTDLGATWSLVRQHDDF